MKVYILLDGEGITGVVDHERQVKPGCPGYEEMRKLLMSDLNSAIEGALEGGARKVVVYDMHYYGLNVILSEVPPEAEVVMGKPPKIAPPAGLDESFDALIMIGFHSMAQTKEGLLPHTYTLDMKALRLNGILMGEIGLEASIAGTRNVPLVMISGDSAAMKEAGDLVGDFEQACVKYAAGEHGALCLPPSKTSKLIREKAKAALKRINDFKPYKVNPPYTIEIEFYDESSARKASAIEGVTRKDISKVEMKGDDLALLWESFLSKYTA